MVQRLADRVESRKRRQQRRVDVQHLVRERIECCVRIGQYKRDHDVPMMQPHRIGVVQERAARYGERHGIDGEFLRRLYDVIIDETCRVEELVICERS